MNDAEQYPSDHIGTFRTFKAADGDHFENRYLNIY